MKIGNMNFDSTLKVIQKNDSSLFQRDQRSEVYAARVGLIYKDSTVLRLCQEKPACYGTIESGRKSVQKIIGFGKK